MDKDLENAAKILNRGEIVIFPTDTVYGIGCRIDREDSVKKLFTIRKRPESKAAPVLVGSISQAKEYFLPIPQKIENLMKKHWPGALTIVYFCKKQKIPSLVRGGGETIGLRMPNHPFALKLIEKVDVPILGPSANFHGDKTPKTFDELDSKLVALVNLAVKGEIKLGIASTVVDCTQKTFKILRQGGVILDEKDLEP